MKQGREEILTIPCSTYSNSIEDSWFVFSSTHVPTKKSKIVDTFIGGKGGKVKSKRSAMEGFVNRGGGEVIQLWSQ